MNIAQKLKVNEFVFSYKQQDFKKAEVIVEKNIMTLVSMESGTN